MTKSIDQFKQDVEIHHNTIAKYVRKGTQCELKKILDKLKKTQPKILEWIFDKTDILFYCFSSQNDEDIKNPEIFARQEDIADLLMDCGAKPYQDAKLENFYEYIDRLALQIKKPEELPGHLKLPPFPEFTDNEDTPLPSSKPKIIKQKPKEPIFSHEKIDEIKDITKQLSKEKESNQKS